MSDPGKSKRRAAALSVASNTVLVLSKLAIGLFTRSVAIISEAVHSAMDLLASLIALAAVTYADRPPDAEHPHGHGKIENLSGAVEALLIFGAVVFIGYESIQRLIQGGEVRQILLGVVVMGFSAAVNIAVSWHLQRVGRRTDSIALLADAAHLRTDVYTSAGVLVGLLIVHFTAIQWLDPVVAMSVALLIVWEAWVITRQSVSDLLDHRLPDEDHKIVSRVIYDAGLTFHALRSRKSGPTRFVNLHLDVKPSHSVKAVHRLCDEIEAEIQRQLPNTQLMIHPEPLLELDATLTIRDRVTQVLDGHEDLFLSCDDLFICEQDCGPVISLHLQVDPTLTVEAAHQTCAHLQEHIVKLVPDARVTIQVEPPDAGGDDGCKPGCSPPGDGGAQR